MYIPASFVIDLETISVLVDLWIFYAVLLIYISAFVPVSHCFDDYYFVVQSEVREPDYSSSIFFLKISLAIQALLCFHTDHIYIYVLIYSSNYVESSFGNFIGIALTL